ncbi:MAG: TIGR04283 family arsenosugar biosynthesis glycosyltransferase [Bacteroidota bacterium]
MATNRRISVIVPALNEAGNLKQLIPALIEHGGPHVAEVIVVDGGSSDDSVQVARAAGAVTLVSPVRGRGPQMNVGVEQSAGDVLYFVHADARPPASYASDILSALEDGALAGCYRFTFDSPSRLLSINAYFTRFNRIWCRGGDQSLFLTRATFDRLGGYRDDFVIMEDYDLIQRLQEAGPFRIIPKNVVVSARKYATNSYLRVQIANLIVMSMYRLGASQERMAGTYRRMLTLG